MEEKKRIVNLIYQNTITSFALSILAISATGWMLGDSQIEFGGIFRLGSAGLSFQSIAQIFALSLALGVLNTLLTSDLLFRKVMLLWRMVSLLFLGVVSCIIFAIVFRWFPLNMWEAWAAFLGFFVGGFGLGSLGMIAKTKIEDKRYNKALSNHKLKREGSKDD
ncbi:MAG: hypothetical protein FWB97_00035 [Oscillospiraceae bacterium]|nr:hypothetical protein [Oscillospiraceae bacterium]